MKKTLTTLFSVTLLSLPIIIQAATVTSPGQTSVPVASQAVFDIIMTIINWAFYLLLAAAALVVVFAAYLFLTAAGDPDKTGKARNYILYALIAVVVGFLAKAIVSLVAKMLGVDVGGIIF